MSGSTPPGSTSPGSTSPGSTSPGSTSPGPTPPGPTSPGSTSPGPTPPGPTSPGPIPSGPIPSGSIPPGSAGPSVRRSAGPTADGYRPSFKDQRDASSNLFDLRYLIGGLFSLYGLILVVASFFVSRAKAGGIDMDLYLGIGMLVLGVFFLLWARLRPLRVQGRSALAQAESAAAGGDDAGTGPHDVDLHEDAGVDVPPASRAQADALRATERDLAGRVGPVEDLRDDADLDPTDLDLRDDTRLTRGELRRGQHRRRGPRP